MPLVFTLSCDTRLRQAVLVVRIAAIDVRCGSIVFAPKPSRTDTARPADCS